MPTIVFIEFHILLSIKVNNYTRYLYISIDLEKYFFATLTNRSKHHQNVQTVTSTLLNNFVTVVRFIPQFLSIRQKNYKNSRLVPIAERLSNGRGTRCS